MAASANNNKDNSSNNSLEGATSVEQKKNGGGGGTVDSSIHGGINVISSPSDKTATQAALRHNPGISVEWTSDEQSTLEDLLSKHASDSTIVRYAKIAMELRNKTVRDVALRCRWMTKKENGKRRKEDHTGRKSKDKKEKATDLAVKPSSQTQLSSRPNGPSYAPPMLPVDVDDGISFKTIGGVTGDLLEQNAQFLTQISSDFASFQIHDNINLLSKIRDNILTILNDLNDMPEIMKQMPPLPVKVNQELANSILPPSSHSKKS